MSSFLAYKSNYFSKSFLQCCRQEKVTKIILVVNHNLKSFLKTFSLKLNKQYRCYCRGLIPQNNCTWFHCDPVAMLRLPHHFYIYKMATRWQCSNCLANSTSTNGHSVVMLTLQLTYHLHIYLQHGHTVAMLRLPRHFYIYKMATRWQCSDCFATSTPTKLPLVAMLRLPRHFYTFNMAIRWQCSDCLATSTPATWPIGGNAQITSPLLHRQNCHWWQCADCNFLATSRPTTWPHGGNAQIA